MLNSKGLIWPERQHVVAKEVRVEAIRRLYEKNIDPKTNQSPERYIESKKKGLHIPNLHDCTSRVEYRQYSYGTGPGARRCQAQENARRVSSAECGMTTSPIVWCVRERRGGCGMNDWVIGKPYSRRQNRETSFCSVSRSDAVVAVVVVVALLVEETMRPSKWAEPNKP